MEHLKVALTVRRSADLMELSMAEQMVKVLVVPLVIEKAALKVSQWVV
jgi:hypothetical protein